MMKMPRYLPNWVPNGRSGKELRTDVTVLFLGPEQYLQCPRGRPAEGVGHDQQAGVYTVFIIYMA
jgi:hypothetical protein